MTEKQTQPKPEIKQFNLICIGDQISTSGNMTLNEVADTLVTLAYGQGVQEGKKKEEEKKED